MKTLPFILLLLALTSCVCVVNATNYYFSSLSGDDSRTSTQAQNSSTPWKTLDKLNSFFSSLNPGDAVLFKRGEEYPGFIIISKSGSSGSPITLGAFGSGAKPLITGFTTISSWTSVGNGIYESVVSSALSALNIISFNNSFQPMGRWPKANTTNSGYLTIGSHSGTSSITSSQIAGSLNYIGGEVAIRSVHWVINRAIVTSQSSSVVAYKPIAMSGTLYEPTDGFGFFFQNHVNTCTSLGEWCYESSTKKVKMYFGSNNPNSYSIKGSVVDDLVSITSKNYITFDNLSFTGSNSKTFNIVSSSNIQISNCDITYSGINAIYASNSSSNNIKINNCSIAYTNNNAIQAGNSSYWTIQNNLITNTGMIAGMGTGGDGQYFALNSIGSNTLIEYNEINSTGFVALQVNGGSSTIQNNLINGFCIVKDDGAGIYTQDAGVGKVIKNNIILNGTGAPNGTYPLESNVMGIYIDDNAANADILGNSIANCGHSGIYLHNAYNIQVRNNTVYNCDFSQLFLKHNGSAALLRNITIYKNIFVAKTATPIFQPALYFSTDNNDISSFGSADSNYYARPIKQQDIGGDELIFTRESSPIWRLLPQWKTFSGQDAHSKKAPKTITNVNDLRFEYNATTSNKVINLGATYIGIDSVIYSGTITLAPFTSKVLIYLSGTIANQPPVASAGPDQSFFLPTIATTLNGSGIDADGTITSYLWTKISGPTQFNIISPTQSQTVVNTLIQGVYQFQLQVTDNNGAVGKDTVIITVNANTGNQPPVANAGSAQTISLPTNSAILSGSGTDPDGSVASYSWTKVSGPSSGTISNPTSAATSVTGLIQGVYQYQLQVTDNSGATGIAVVQITVNAAPANGLLPAVNPANTVNGLDYKYYEASVLTVIPNFPALTPVKTGFTNNFDISLANRSDLFAFSFTGYINVPADGQYTFYTNSDDGSNLYIDNVLVVNNDGLHAAVEVAGTIGLQAGKHAISVGFFEQGGGQLLTVSYAGPGVSKQTIPASALYRVTAVANQPPVANAGSAQTISLPTNSAILSGSGTDPDGSVASYSWTKVSGPSSGTISNPTSAATSVTGLIQGVYQYQLQVTDNSGATGIAVVQITVNAAPANGLLPAVNPANTVNGLDYKYYEASVLTVIPNFPALTPVKTGFTNNFDISLANRSDLFAFSFTGYINVPADGQYTFYTNSDDGSNLYIDNVLVVNNDGLHAAVEVAGTIGLQAGKHAISVGFFEQGGGQLLTVSYAGPGVSKQTIPASALYRVTAVANQPPVANAGSAQTISLPTNSAILSGSGTDPDGSVASYSWTKVSGPSSGTISNPTSAATSVTGLIQGVYQYQLQVTDNSGATGIAVVQITVNAAPANGLLPAVNPANTVNGLDYKYYEASVLTVIPNFPALTPVKTGFTNNFDISLANRSDLFAFSFTGYINVPADGQYTFYTNSDDGSNLYIDNVLVVNNDGLHAAVEVAGTIGLQAGKHAISVGFFEQGGGQLLTVSYAGPGVSKQTIPASALYRVTAVANQPPVANAGSAQTISLPTNSAILSGSGTDPDGSVASYSWTKVSGPSSGTISNPTSAATSVTGLIQGVYQYQLQVTDNSGATGIAVVQITVNAAPANGLLPAVNPANTVNGLDYKYYEASVLTVIPNFPALTPVKTGFTNNFDISLANRSDLFAFSFTGYINVPADGQYTFYTNSDDGSNLYIDNVLVVNNDGLHAAVEVAGTIGLQAGKHAISVGFFEQGGGQLLTVSYAGPGVSKQTIPASALYRVTAPANNVVARFQNGIIEQPITISTEASIKTSPNPFTNSILINIFGEEGNYKLTLIDVSGRTVWTKSGIKPGGVFQQKINTSSYEKGVYFLQVIQNKTSSVIELLK